MFKGVQIIWNQGLMYSRKATLIGFFPSQLYRLLLFCFTLPLCVCSCACASAHVRVRACVCAHALSLNARMCMPQHECGGQGLVSYVIVAVVKEQEQVNLQKEELGLLLPEGEPIVAEEARQQGAEAEQAERSHLHWQT